MLLNIWYILLLQLDARGRRTSYAPFGSFTFQNLSKNKTDENRERPKRHIKNSFLESNLPNSLPDTLASRSETVFSSKTVQSSFESQRTETIVHEKDATTNNKGSSQYFGHLDCGPTQCTYIACTVGPLKKKEYVVFRVRSRLWTTTVAKVVIEHISKNIIYRKIKYAFEIHSWHFYQNVCFL